MRVNGTIFVILLALLLPEQPVNNQPIDGPTNNKER